MLSCLWKQLPWLPVTFLHWLLHSRQPFALRDSVTRFLTQLFCLTNSTWAPFEKIPNFFPFCEDKLRNSQFFCENEKFRQTVFACSRSVFIWGPYKVFFFLRKASKSRDTLSLSCLVLNCCLVAFCFLFSLKLSLVTLLFCCVVVCGCHRPAPPPSPRPSWLPLIWYRPHPRHFQMQNAAKHSLHSTEG